MVFSLSPDGILTAIHSFGGDDGYSLTGGLVQDRDGNIYGTTRRGGANDSGTIFRLSPDGIEFTVLHSFDMNEGSKGLIKSRDGSLYGTAEGGDGHFYGVNPRGGKGGEGVVLRLRRPGTPFRRGDVNADGATDISDAVATLSDLFLGTQ